MQDVKDITIIGAGPTGLFGAFYAGMRGASCRLIDNLDQVGGQLTALYPEKYIFDVAGFPKVLSKDLVKGMGEQAFQFKQPVHLGENVTGLKRYSENGKLAFTVVTDKDEYPSRTVLIAGGIGAFTPRKLPLKDVDRWNGKGLHDRVLDPKVFSGKRVLLVGGGDSAFDWAVNLQGIARSIVMIHRRDGFRAHAATVRQVRELSAAGKMELRTFWELKTIHGDERIEAVTIFNSKTKVEERLAVDNVIPQLGLISPPGAIPQWGLDIEQGEHLCIRHRMPVRLNAEGDGPAVRLLDVARQAVDAIDAAGLRDHAALERAADEAFEERARLSRVRQRRHERRSLGMAMHVRQQLGERMGGDQVAGREPRPVLEREGGRVDLHRVDQEAALHVQPRLPGALPLDFAPQHLEQHFREPVLAGVEDREDDVGQRTPAILDQRGAAAPRRPVGE